MFNLALMALGLVLASRPDNSKSQEIISGTLLAVGLSRVLNSVKGNA